MELLRSLAALAEPPSPETTTWVELLELGEVPSEADFTELFVLQLYPYASIYLGAEGMLGGEARDRIAGFWRAVGMVPPKEPDHLTALLALYVGFRDQAVSADDPSQVNATEVEAWNHRAKALLWEHLASWLPFYLKRVQEIATPCYQAWADLLLQALEAEAKYFPSPDFLSSHLRSTRGLTDPRENGKNFLSSLLSPVQSGLILTRRDLARASRDLAFGLRLGERRFILQNLLDQAPQETLIWLSQEAQRQSQLWQGSTEAWPQIAAYWQDRALASNRLLAELQRDDLQATDR